MPVENLNQETWIESFRELMHYCIPPLESTPLVNVVGIVAMAVGLFLVVRGGKFERLLVCAFALVLGGWLGYQLSMVLKSSGPITIAVTSVVVSVIAYRTYRWWLAAGSVAVLFGLALMFQLGRGDLGKYLPAADQTGPPIVGDKIALVAKDVQINNLHPQWREQIAKIGEKVWGEMKDLGLVGWLIPIAAAIVGGMLAYWALRMFAVVWLGFIGAHLAVLGGSTVLCANWDTFRDSLFAHPRYPAGIAVGVWLLGLILQAKEARFPRQKPAEVDKAPAKS